MDDATLIAQVQAGNAHAYRFLVEKHKNLVWHMVLRLVNRQEDAEDLTQEVFFRVFRDLGKFRGEAKLSTWIGAITYNMCISHLRKKGREIMVPVDDYTPVARGKIATESAEQAMDRNSLKKLIHQVIESLPVQYRTVITLFYLEELSYKEIEEITGMPDGTVKSYLNRGRQMLREKLVHLVPDINPVLIPTES
ncbi:MAG: sigma-70 family RNA polymerase sigma factor [bacterium]